MSELKENILLVEDEALLAMNEKRQLEKYGYTVRTVTTGEKAVEAVQTSTDIDLILMDINLGKGIDGTQAAEIILRDRDIPIVFLSSHTDPEVVEKTEKITSYGYVVKSSSITVLDASIKMAFKLFEAKVGIKHHRNRLNDINRIGRLANSTLELDAVLTLVLEQTVQALGTSEGMIFLNNPESRTLTWGASVGLSQAFVDEFSVNPIQMGEGLTGRIAETGTPIFIPENSSHDSRIERAVVDQEALESFIGVPIFADDRVVGVMNILTRPPSCLTEDNVDFCSAIGVQVGSAIKNARLYTQQGRVTEELIEARTKAIESEAKWRSYIENAPDGVFVTDEDGKYIEVNKAACRITGYSEDELLDMTVLSLIQEEYLAEAANHFRIVAKNGFAGAEGMGFVTKSGERRFWNVDAVKLSETRYLGFVKDTTDRTQREEEQRRAHDELLKAREKALATEERTRYILKYNPNAIAVFDNEMNILMVSDRFLEDYNVKNQDIIGKNHYDVFPEIPERWRDAHRRALHGEVLSNDDDSFVRRDGSTTYTRWECRPWYEADGTIGGMIAYTEVITERKQIEEDLHTISKLQSIILRMASDYINNSIEHVDETINDSLKAIGEFVDADRAYVFEYDWVMDVANNTYEWCNEGVTPEIDQLQGVPNKVLDYWVEAHRNGQEMSIEDVMHLPSDDGVRQILEPQGVKSVLALPMMRQGECIGFVGFDSVRETKKYSETEKTLLKVFAEMLVNIGHRQELEKNLIQAKEQAEENSADLTAIIEGATDSIWSFDGNYDIRYINNRLRDDFHAAFGVRLEVGSNLIDALPEAIRPIWKPRYDMVLSNEQFIVTDEVETVHGKQFLEVSFNPIVQGDRVIGGSCFGSDITVRTQAEQEIQRQLAEKETLFKEVHHRIKNNMAQIESLLSIQANAAESADVKSALNTGMSRVRSTRILYEKLLVGQGHEEVSVKEYLESLIESHIEVYRDNADVSIETKIVDFSFNAKKAVPIGIILNELLTNAFKYAFEDRATGHILVELAKTDSKVALTVQDNGVGFNERVAANKSTGFGLTLTRMLAEQLAGTFTIDNDGGTKSVVTFSV